MAEELARLYEYGTTVEIQGNDSVLTHVMRPRPSNWLQKRGHSNNVNAKHYSRKVCVMKVKLNRSVYWWCQCVMRVYYYSLIIGILFSYHSIQLFTGLQHGTTFAKCSRS